MTTLSLGFLVGAVVAAVVAQTAIALGSSDSNGPDEPSLTCHVKAEQCREARTVIESLPYPWSVVGYDVEIRVPPDSWHDAKTIHGEDRIELYVNDETTDEELARTFVHEIAHTILNNCGDKRLDAWRNRRNLPPSVPDSVDAPHDFDSVAEDAAEAFAQYLTGQSSRSTVGDEITDDWLQANSELFATCRSRGDR